MMTASLVAYYPQMRPLKKEKSPVFILKVLHTHMFFPVYPAILWIRLSARLTKVKRKATAQTYFNSTEIPANCLKSAR
jgi:hypothetical protein